MAQEQNIPNIEKALKNNYLPLWRNQLNTDASIIMGKVGKKPLTSDKIVAAAPLGISGGFGFGAEGQATPAAGAVQFEGFETRAKDMYCEIIISDKATELTGPGGSMADALRAEIKGAYDAAAWNVGRSLFGNGQGILAQVTALAVAGNTFTVDNARNLIEGLTIDIYAAGGTVPAVAKRRITAINRATKQVTIDGAATTLAAGFVTVQNSFMREITGLGAIFDDTITSLYGVDKAANIWIKPTVESGSGGIEDGIITRTLRNAERDKNSKVDMLLFGDDAYDAYVDYLRQNNDRIESRETPVGGHRALKFVFSNREVLIANERFVPVNEMWGFETETIKFHNIDWGFAQLKGGGIFNLMETRSAYRALLRNYGSLIWDNPGGCVRIHGVPSL